MLMERNPAFLLPRLRHNPNRRRAKRTPFSRDRYRPCLCRCCNRALGGDHWSSGATGVRGWAMTKRQGPSGGSVSTRFKSGQSGNPKGRPRKPRPPAPSPFAILDELLTVRELESVSELPLEDAMLIKTYQRAITGSRRAAKKIVKMILEREKLRSNKRAPRRPQVAIRIEQVDPENALEALEILGIASRTANANAGDTRHAHLRLERWAAEAALRRGNFGELPSSDIEFIRGWTHDGVALKWPRGSLDHA